MRQGRKRKLRARYANGRLVYKAPNDRALAAAQPHRRGLPEPARLSEAATTELGQLWLRCLITEPMHLAGQKYGAVANAYLSTVVASRHRLLDAGRGISCDASACRPGECLCLRRERDFLELRNVLIRAGPQLELAVANVCVFDRPPVDVEPLRLGLMTLARYMRL